MRIVVGITGATGVLYGVRLLRALGDLGVESHLVMSRWAEATIALSSSNVARTSVAERFPKAELDRFSTRIPGSVSLPNSRSKSLRLRAISHSVAKVPPSANAVPSLA